MDNAQFDALRQLLPDSEEETERLERLTAIEGQSKPRLVVYGTYNAGKSSLLNALTGHYETDFFRVNDIPETRAETAWEGEHFIYIDTPGLDVDLWDDRVARHGIASADLVLLVHRLSAGSLQKEDAAAFKRLAEVSDVLLVLTGAEQAEEETGLISEITEMLNNFTAKPIPIFPVATPRYFKGMREGKLKLASASGIPALIAQLEQRSIALRAELENDRKARRTALLEQLLQAAKTRQRAARTALQDKTHNMASRQQQFLHDVQHFRRELQQKLADYNKLI
ncbi:GTPase domain-containing protein [Erwinia sp. CGal63]|uniref:GTPase domain-containing protein n=1 Tax=Erwinia sp. CGal63 TaxID=2919889 RepID=UPI00300823A6